MRLSRVIAYSIGLVFFLSIVIQWNTAFTYGGGPPASHTGAPSESHCGTSGCHTQTPSSPGSIFSFSNGKSTQDYIPDSVYQITIKFSPSGAGRWGFQATALTSSTNKMAGSFTKAGSGTQKITGTVGGSTREYMEHTSTGAGSSNSGTWTFEWTAPSSNVGDIKFYFALNAADGGGTAGNDVIYTTSVTLSPSSKLPTASFTATPTTICVGDTVSFDGSGTNSPTSYSWTFPSGTPSSSTTEDAKATWKAAGNYNVSLVVGNAYGKSATVTKQVQVKAKPDTVITAGGSTTICEGDSVLLSAAGGLTYKWNNDHTGQSIYVKQSGSYSATLSNGACSSKSQTIKVTVLAKPNPTVTTNLNGAGVTDTATICDGDSLVMTVTPGPKFATYTFYDKNFIRQTGSSNVYSVQGTLTYHLYSVVVTDSNGCVSDKTEPINVLFKKRTVAPVVSTGTPTTSTVTFSWNAVTGATGYEVSADSGKTWKTPSSGATDTSHTETGLGADMSVRMMVRATDATECKYGTAKEIVLKTLPCSELTYDVDYDEIICPGSNAVITFSNFSSATYAIILNGAAPSKDLVYTVSPGDDSTFAFEIVDSLKLNCEPIKLDVEIKVDDIPVLTIIPDKLSYCEGEEAALSANGGFTSYAFAINGAEMQNSASLEFKTSALKPGDKVSVTGTTANGCESQPAVVTPTVFANPAAGFTAAKNYLQITFSDTTADAASRTWHFGDGSTSTDANPSHTYAAQGNYTVSLKVTNANGCTDSVAQVVYAQSSGVGETPADITGISVFPNPVEEELTIIMHLQRSSRIQVKLYDGKGMSVFQSDPRSYAAGRQEIKVPAGHLKGGVYFMQVVSGTQVLTQKILKKQEK